MQRFARYLSHQSKDFIMTMGILLTAFLGLIDYLTGPEIQLSVFYLLPIALTTWLLDQYCGFFMCLFSSMVIFWAQKMSAHHFAHAAIPYWNTLVALDFFLIVTILLVEIKQLMEQEKENARTDFLTGAANRRYFHEMIQKEIERARRYNHIFSVAYMDVDNFKFVNDQLGHMVGDDVLRSVTAALHSSIRITDTVARLGGDEFGILLSETGFRESDLAVKKIRGSLNELVQKNRWPISFSIGVVTYTNPAESVEDVLHRADEMMYVAKQNKDTPRSNPENPG